MSQTIAILESGAGDSSWQWAHLELQHTGAAGGPAVPEYDDNCLLE